MSLFFFAENMLPMHEIKKMDENVNVSFLDREERV